MSRPPWCPHADCRWITGGGSPDDSGVVCGGELPAPILHNQTPNTHRLCLRTAEGVITDLQVNATDLWYFGLIIGKLHNHARNP